MKILMILIVLISVVNCSSGGGSKAGPKVDCSNANFTAIVGDNSCQEPIEVIEASLESENIDAVCQNVSISFNDVCSGSSTDDDTITDTTTTTVSAQSNVGDETSGQGEAIARSGSFTLNPGYSYTADGGQKYIFNGPGFNGLPWFTKE